MSDVQNAASFWDSEVAHPTHVSWMENPEVRGYINRAIGGAQALWPLDWFQAAYPGRTFRRALSIGCGGGALERDLIRRGLCQSVDAFDGSMTSLHNARKESQKEGWGDRIHYFAADFNDPIFGGASYDLVLVHQAMHHVAKLEKLLRAVLNVLTAGGLFYLEEMIGPSRTDWDEESHATHQAMYQLLPREWRLYDRLPLPIQPDDPSEAIRSAEIVDCLKIGFEIAHKRDYGGNALSILYNAIDWSRAPQELVERLIECDRALLVGGDSSYHAVIVAQPKLSLDKTLALLRYTVEPKLRRIRFETIRRLTGKAPRF